MGGDHKCPVCQATFTRPQHVARHMRSHTGDRPYKCQHCGDQFARSDLLSRHVNKCHAAEKSLLSSSSSGGMSGGSAGRRKGGTAATRATTSKQACDQCVQSSLPCDGSNPCAKCIARKTRCTFVKFHRQTAPVGPGHPSSLSASHPQSQSASSSSSASASSASSGLAHPSLLGLGLAPLSAPLEQQPFLYAQQAASGVGVGQFAFPHGQHSPGPVFTANASADEGQGRFAHHPGRFGGGSVSPTYPGDYHSHSHSPHRRERDSAYYSASSGGSAYGGGGGYGGEYEYADSEHSGHSGGSMRGSESAAGSIGGSRPTSSAGVGDYPYLSNGRHHASASLDLHDPRHHSDLRDLHHPSHSDLHLQQRPPEFSSAFGLMSLDDPNVLAGLSNDGVPFFSHTGRTGLTPGGGGLDLAGGGGKQQRMPQVPLGYHHYSPPSSSHSHSGVIHGQGQQGQTQTPGSREAETRELREFWKAYMRTPLTGPGPHADALGLQTPSASAGAGVGPGGMLGITPTRENSGGMMGRRYRVASLPSVKTPEGELDAAPVYPVPHMQGQHLPQQHAQQQQQQAPQGRTTMHSADDLRSYEAAVLARKAPELVLRKPARRPTMSAGGAAAPHPPPPHPTVFEFGASGRERGGAAGAGAGPGLDASGGSQSSLAGAFGFAGAGYATAPGAGNANSTGTGSQPNSPFPGTPTSTTSASASASASASEDEGDGRGRPSFKRLPSQTLGPMLTKRRKDRTEMEAGLGMAHLAPPTPALGTGAPEAGPPSVVAYPDRPMISLRAPPQGAIPQRRARRLSAPVSPKAATFPTD